MKKKSKTVLWGFFSLDYKAMEAYLEQMAQQGWMLEKVGRVTAKFRAIEPHKVKFYVDVFKGGGPLMPEKSMEAEAYRATCEKLGWNFIASQDYLQFFYADSDKDPAPIRTDEAVEQKIVERTILKQELLSILLFLVIASVAIITHFPLKHTSLLSFIGVAGTFVFPFFIIPMLYMAMYSLLWMGKARRNIKMGLPMEKPNVHDARRRGMIFHICIYILASIFFISIIGDVLFIPNIGIPILLGPIGGVFIGLLLRHIIKKRTKSKENAVLYAVVGTLVAVLAVTTTGALLMGRNVPSTAKDQTIPQGYPSIAIEELVEGVEEGRLVDRYFRPGKSPVVPTHYSYWEVWEVEGESKSLGINYYETIHPYFTTIVFDGVRKEIDWRLSWRNRTTVYDQAMRQAWDMDAVVITEERDELVIQQGNRVLRIWGDIDFDAVETRERIVASYFTKK